MKKIHVLLVGFFLVTSFFSTAQNLDVSWGQEIKPERLTRISSIIASDKDGYLIVKAVGCGLFGDCKRVLTRYNLNHEVQYEIELPTTVNGKDAMREGTYHVEGKTLTFLSIDDKKNNIKRLYVVNIGDKGKVGKEKLIDEINYDGKKTNGGFDIRYLEKNKSFSIIHDAGFSKKGLEQVNYKCIDTDFKLIWEKDIELEYQDSKFNIESYQFDEEGNVFMYGLLSVGKKHGVTKNDVAPIVFAYYYKKDELKELTAGLDQVTKIKDVRLRYVKGQLHLLGFYLEKKGGLKGLVSTKINAKTLKVEQEKSIEFSKKDLATIVGERESEKDNGVQRPYEIRGIYQEENGDCFVIAEEYYEMISYSSDPKTGVQTPSSRNYYYNNIMVIKLSEDGEIIWVQKIPKIQVSRDDLGHYSSFCLITNKDNFYFLFNDNIKNLAPGLDPKKKGKTKANTLRPGKLVVNLTTLNKETGNTTSELFFKSKTDGKTALVPKMCESLNEKTLFLYADKGKSYRFGFLKLK